MMPHTTTLQALTGSGRLTSGRALEKLRPPPSVLCWKYLLELAIVFAAYYLGGKVGLAVPFTSGNVSPLWPPAGIAVAALLLVGYRVWPALAAGAFLVNFLTPISSGAAVALAIGNTAGPVVAAWLVRRLPGFRPSLGRLRDVLGLILLAAPTSAAISATFGVSVLFETHVNPWSGFWPAWLVWWLGDAIGVLVVTPLALTLVTWRQMTKQRHVAELVTLLLAVAITSLVIFDSRAVFGVEKDVFAFAVLPVVLWGAIRFGIPGAAGVTLLITCLAVWKTGADFGPFVRNSSLQNATLLQGFLAVIAVSGLTLAAVIVERAELLRLQARHEAETRYREIVETANDGIWMLDAELATVFVNARMADILGYTVEQMVGRPLADFMSAPAWKQMQADLRRCGPAVRERAQARYRKQDGSDVWVTVSRTCAFGEDGTLTGVLEMVSDISDQRRAETERQQALARVMLLSKAVEQTADSVLICDGAGQIEYVNPAFEGTTGYTRDEAVGQTPRLLKSGRHGKAFYEQIWNLLLAGESYQGTLVNRKKTGELYWANQTITPIKDSEGNITHFVAVLKDVTAIRKYHEQEVRLRIARTVQQRFSPPQPGLRGFDIAATSHPADETGGDYFDFIEASPGVLYVAIGDVSGHGFDAALIMSLTRAYMRAFAPLGTDVGEVLGRVNRALLGDIEENRYVTMLLVRLDAETASMTYASAGHPPGLLLNRSSGIDAVVDSTGIPLGMFADATFATRRVQFRPPQILVLGTDGATETRDSNGLEFGRDGVIEYVRAHANETAGEIAAGLYGAARSFGAPELQDDDITSVIVKVGESPRRVRAAQSAV